MNQNSNYCVTVLDEKDLANRAEEIFDIVWRVDFTAPGFVALEIAHDLDSHRLRRSMIELKERFSDIGHRRGYGRFIFRSMSRFDQQETTKFHIDGAPDQSMLMLGYEPSDVQSRLYLADFSKAAFDLGITPQQFMNDFNPMFRKDGDELLSGYVTELPQLQSGRSRIVLINNSSLPFTETRTNALGVMHKAIIVTPDSSRRRIVNSTLLTLGEGDEPSEEQQLEFINTDKISPKVYRK